MAFRRHAHLYGTTEEQLGHIAVTAREYAALNPAAVFRTPLSIEDYLARPYLVEPLRRPDLCMISDGGVSLIVTSAERARELRPDPVYLLGMAQPPGLRLDASLGGGRWAQKRAWPPPRSGTNCSELIVRPARCSHDR